jgi:hypothetical protein
MSRRLRAGLPIALPLAVLSCTDLSNLATGADDAGPDAQADAGAPEVGGGDVPACPAGTKSCNDGCVPVDDPAYGCAPDACAPCSVPYATDVACKEGRCAVATCQPGRADCNGRGDDGCEADLGSPTTCNGCGTACPSGQVCASGAGCVLNCPSTQTNCNGSCVDLTANPNHCGDCNTKCPVMGPNSVPGCTASKCAMACNAGFDDCDPSTAGCEPKIAYYVDADRDGYGTGAATGAACTPPEGNATKLGDCLDSDARVHPGQTTFYGAGYTSAAGMLSYDYNCNGTEEDQGPRGMCAATCAVGYAPGAKRLTPGANEYCGSTSFVTGCSGTSGGSGSGSGSCQFSATAPDGCR